MRNFADALVHNPPIYLREMYIGDKGGDGKAILAILQQRPVVYIVEYNDIVENVIGIDMPPDECEKFQLTEITSLQMQWGAARTHVLWDYL